jgi:hypothetical protein
VFKSGDKRRTETFNRLANVLVMNPPPKALIVEADPQTMDDLRIVARSFIWRQIERDREHTKLMKTGN